MIQVKINGLEMRVSEMSKFLKISRVTMYKYMDDYDHGKKIPKNIRQLFDKITLREFETKNDILKYLINM